MISVLPEGGLCNRLRVVASSLMLARAANQPLRVYWLRTNDFNSRFDMLFETEGLPFEIIERQAMSSPTRAIARSRKWLAWLQGSIIFGHSDTEPGSFDITKAIKRIGNCDVFIHTNSRLGFQPGMFDVFRPVGQARSAIEKLQPRLTASVGVHIRRTDNLVATAESTLERFEAAMQAERTLRPYTQFFIATDDSKTLSHLSSVFGLHVWEYAKRSYSRNDPMAIIDAVVDLFALANTQKIIGSYWSSFTDTAAELRGIECTIVRSA